MDWGISFLNELQKMKEHMDRTWNDLSQQRPGDKEEAWQWVEKLPKFEGPGRSNSKSRGNRIIK